MWRILSRSSPLCCPRSARLQGRTAVGFRLNDEFQALCLEVNTLPGMTGTSLVPKSAAAAGIEFGELCEKIIALS